MKTRRQTYKKCGDMRRRRRRKGPFDEDTAETRRDEKKRPGQARRGFFRFETSLSGVWGPQLKICDPFLGNDEKISSQSLSLSPNLKASSCWSWTGILS